MTRSRKQRQSFVIRVIFTEHNSWQGILTHLESGEEFSFRSTMEMLMLMDKLLETDKDDTKMLKQRKYANIRAEEKVIGKKDPTVLSCIESTSRFEGGA